MFRYLGMLGTLLLCHPAQSAENITIVAGSPSGGYHALAQDIARLASPSGTSIAIQPSSGVVDTIRHLAANSNMLGIIQSDTPAFLKRSQNLQSIHIAERLRVVLPLHSEEVHLLARKNITRFTDLTGKRVIVGEEGSSSLITAVNLFAIAHVTPARILKISPSDAVVTLLKNQADAMLLVGSKPIKLFKNMDVLAADKDTAPLLEGLHFVPLDDPDMLKEYEKAEITSKDYAFTRDTIPTIAVSVLLVSLPSENDANERCNFLGALDRSIRAQLPNLRAKTPGKWQRIDLDKQGTWQRDPCLKTANLTEAN